MKLQAISLLFIVLSAISCKDEDSDDGTGANDPDRVPAAALIPYNMINSYPHDTAAFTEGLTYYKGQLYESTGAPPATSNNGSWIATLDLPTGKYQRKVDLGDTFFGEGITILNDKVYQLTWTTKKGFVYDLKTFKKLREFTYQSEGWGLTNDGKSLIMSAGTSNLYYLDPDSLKFTKTLAVQDNNGPVGNINELEYIDGYIYSNRWLTGDILKIDPSTGIVVGRIDLSKIVNDIKSKYPNAEEMNGIAYDSAARKIVVTGKKWPYLYEIKW